jgi:hypothetical protein
VRCYGELFGEHVRNIGTLGLALTTHKEKNKKIREAEGSCNG